jgi:hypothetical protein
MFPGLGKDAVGLMLSVRRGKLTLTQSGEVMSAAGDLAYAYGKYLLSQITERRARALPADLARG